MSDENAIINQLRPNSKIKVFLLNGFHFSGAVRSTTNEFIVIDEPRGLTQVIAIQQIARLEVLP